MAGLHPCTLQSSYILDAGIEAGLELPYTCKGGICGCCVGRVAEGEVDQSDVSWPVVCPTAPCPASCCTSRPFRWACAWCV